MTWLAQWFCVPPWTGGKGAITARLLILVPTAETGLLGVETGMDMPLKAALLAVVLGPWLEGWQLYWGMPLGM